MWKLHFYSGIKEDFQPRNITIVKEVASVLKITQQFLVQPENNSRVLNNLEDICVFLSNCYFKKLH